MTEEILTGDVETVRNMGICRDIGEALHSKYPGHAWAIDVTGGMVNIKDLFISSLYGIRLKLDDVQHDYGHRVKTALRAGGELLERAYLPRSGLTPEKVTKVDGIDNYQRLGAF